MMKQLDFFFDFFARARSAQSPDGERLLSNKTLVAGGRQASADVIFVHGHAIRVRRRPYARHISLTVRPNRIVVTAGRTVPLKMLVKFTSESWEWVEKQKQSWLDLRSRFPQKNFEPGEHFPVQGIDHSLRLRLTPSRKGGTKIENGNLVVEVPQKNATSQAQAREYIKGAVRSFYEDMGRRIISERLHIYCQKLQLFPKEVSYRNQKTRWGSCSSSGHLSFNWRLSAAPLEVIDYVVVHELVHLKHANHSRHFWKAVEAEIPRWKKIRRWLAENQFAFDFLAEISELHEAKSAPVLQARPKE